MRDIFTIILRVTKFQGMHQHACASDVYTLVVTLSLVKVQGAQNSQVKVTDYPQLLDDFFPFITPLFPINKNRVLSLKMSQNTHTYTKVMQFLSLLTNGVPVMNSRSRLANLNVIIHLFSFYFLFARGWERGSFLRCHPSKP